VADVRTGSLGDFRDVAMWERFPGRLAGSVGRPVHPWGYGLAGPRTALILTVRWMLVAAFSVLSYPLTRPPRVGSWSPITQKLPVSLISYALLPLTGFSLRVS
jgi:hypothetical protein